MGNKHRWALVALVALAATPLEAQVPPSLEELERQARDTTAATDSVLLGKIRRDGVAFVPTPDRVLVIVRARPWLRDELEAALVEACVKSFTPLDLSISDVRFLVRRGSARCRDEEAILVYAAACPRGGAYASVRSVAKQGASRKVLDHLAALCRVKIARPKWEVAGWGGRWSLAASEAMRAEQMEFQTGGGGAVRISYAPRRTVAFATTVEFAGHRYDPPQIDLRPAGEFSLVSLVLSTRVLVSCLWQRAGCGDPLFANGDVFAEGRFYAWSQLSGEINLTATPAELANAGVNTTGPFEFVFTGSGYGLGAGYRWRMTRLLAFEVEASYSTFSFGRISVTTPTASLEDDIGGRSTRFGIAGSFVLRLGL